MDKLIAAATEKTTDVLIGTGLMLVDVKGPAARMSAAAITDVILSRHPELNAVADAWSEDLETELDLIEVLALELAA
jgi:hypothetical protein